MTFPSVLLLSRGESTKTRAVYSLRFWNQKYIDDALGGGGRGRGWEVSAETFF